MKKVLLISPYPYSRTGRGMDVLTECFEESDWETSHLNFPNVFYTVQKTKKFNTNVKEYVAKKVLIPYVDSIMSWFPKFLFKVMVKYQQYKASFINFDSYDYIVVESGKPLFLLDLIPCSSKIIYRQSDSVRHVLGKNKHYIDLEDQIYIRAEKIVVVKERFKNILDKELHLKVKIIRNGYSIPNNLELINPYKPNTINAIYVGLTKLDLKTISQICKNNPKLDIHIFGNCLKKRDLWILKKFENFFYYGFKPRETYLAYIKFANLAIFPFKDWDGMKWVGFTTKYLNFMFYKLPIISYLTGEKSEFDGMGVTFVKNAEEFASEVSKITEKQVKVESNIDFNFFSHEERKKEYKDFIRSL